MKLACTQESPICLVLNSVLSSDESIRKNPNLTVLQCFPIPLAELPWGGGELQATWQSLN